MEHNFKGKWITNELFYNLDEINIFYRQLENKEIEKSKYENMHILFRKHFNISDFKNAYVYISADDFFKLYINGKFVLMGPTQGYKFDYHYEMIDISKYLVNGDNLIAVDSYYHGRCTRSYVSADNQHGLIMDVVVDERTIVSSDESFKTAVHTGYTSEYINKHNTQFIENYDFNALENNFELLDYDDSKWSKSYIKKDQNYILTKDNRENLDVYLIKPKQVTKIGRNTLVDIGQEIVGYPMITFKGNKGDLVTIKSSEELDENGLPLYELRCKVTYLEKYILSGNLDTTKNYDYKGFRYMYIESDSNIEILNIEILVKHYPFREKYKFVYQGDKDLEKVYELCKNTIKYGTLENYVDCPTREKGQYFCDGFYNAVAQHAITGDTKLMRKLLDEEYNSSRIDKSLMAESPTSYMQEIAENSLMAPVLSLIYYKITNDINSLSKDYEYIKDMLDCFRDRYEREDHLVGNFDKWTVVDWPEELRDGYDALVPNRAMCRDYHNEINAYYIESIKCFNEIAHILNKDGIKYYNELVKTYKNTYYNENTDLFVDNIGSTHSAIASNVLPLLIGIVDKESTKENIINMIKEKKFNHSNIYICPIILFALLKVNRKDLIIKLIKDRDTWLCMINEGATTTFEAFSKFKKKNASLFHTGMAFAAIFLTEFKVEELFIKENKNA